VLDVLFELTKFVHQASDLGDSIIVKKHTWEGTSAVLVFIILQVFKRIVSHAYYQHI